MGTRLPLYPYVALDVEISGGKPLSARKALVEDFIAYISRPEVQVLRYNLICNDFDPEADDWVGETSSENDCHLRPRLKSLTKTIGERGSILLPTIGDLTGYQSKPTFDIIDQIILKHIPVLTVAHESFPLSRFAVDSVPTGKVFESMVGNSMDNEDYLRKFMGNRSTMEKHL